MGRLVNELFRINNLVISANHIVYIAPVQGDVLSGFCVNISVEGQETPLSVTLSTEKEATELWSKLIGAWSDHNDTDIIDILDFKIEDNKA